MGRIQDLEQEMEEMDKQADAASTQQTAPTTQEPLATPEIPAASDTPPIGDNATSTPSAATEEIVDKASYDQMVDLCAKMQAEITRQTNAFATLEGKYKAEVPRLQAEKTSLQAQLDTARAELALAQSAAKAPSASLDVAKISEEYGPEIATAFKTMQQQIADLTRQLSTKSASAIDGTGRVSEPQQDQTGAASQQPEQQSRAVSEDFLSALTRAFPGWQFINGDQRYSIPPDQNWGVFLLKPSSIDPSKSWDQIIKSCVQTDNIAGAAEVFRAFRREYPTNGQKKPTGQMTGAEALVDPVNSGGASAQPKDKPIKSMTDYKKFVDDLRKGRLDHLTSQEKGRLEEEWDTALS